MLSIRYKNRPLLENPHCDTELYKRFEHQYLFAASGITLHYFNFETSKTHTLASTYSEPGLKATVCLEGFAENQSPQKKKYYFEAGKTLLYPIGEGSSSSLLEKHTPVRILHFYIPESFVSQQDLACQNLFTSSSLSPGMIRQAQQLLIVPYDSITDKIRTEILLFETLSVLLKPLEKEKLKEIKKPTKNILEAKEYLDAAGAGLISIQALSRIVGVNEFKLKKEFKQLTGKGIFEYQHDRLMKEARTWLSEGMTVTEASEKAGYGSVGNFSNAFFNKFGFRPSASGKY